MFLFSRLRNPQKQRQHTFIINRADDLGDIGARDGDMDLKLFGISRNFDMSF